MRKEEMLEFMIKQLQLKLNKHIEEKGFNDYDALLRTSRELDDVLNEWISVNLVQEAQKRMDMGRIYEKVGE